jgi:PAS domain S-box-containing protein
MSAPEFTDDHIFHLLFENHSSVMLIVEPQSGSIAYANNAAVAFYAYPRADLMSMNILDITQTTWDEFKRRTDVAAGGPGNSFVSRHKLATGEIRAVEVHLSRVTIDATDYIFNIIHDISGRSRLERDLKKSEERFRRLVESVTDYIYEVTIENGQAVGTFHGPGCVAVTGYTSEEYEADGILWYRMIYEEDRPEVMKQAFRLLLGIQTPAIEHRIIHRDGSIRWVRNTPVLRHDNEGKLIAYDGLISDITERKQLQQEIEEKVIQLECSLAKVKQLEGIIPICSYCHKIRDDVQVWQQMEHYISEHSQASFSHGVCPECFQKQMAEIKKRGSDNNAGSPVVDNAPGEDQASL